MKLLNKAILLAFSLSLLAGCKQQDSLAVTIGIIEPLEHNAMTEIVGGFSDTLKQLYHKPVIIKIENAQNDPNLQRAIIQQMHDAHYTLIAPIGIGATTMALSMVHNQPIIGMAANLSDSDRKKLTHCNLAIVHDEIPPKRLIDFIHTTYPKLTELTLIHSAADKVFPQVQEAIAAGKANGITVQQKMVSSLPELYSVANALPAKTQGIFILKDNLIVSGIPTLAKIASTKHIPLITSDQGSVLGGAAFALGVHERETGVQGAKLAAALLEGKSPCALPISEMENLTVFINKSALAQEDQKVTPILQAAKKLSYKVEIVNTSVGN